MRLTIKLYSNRNTKPYRNHCLYMEWPSIYKYEYTTEEHLYNELHIHIA